MILGGGSQTLQTKKEIIAVALRGASKIFQARACAEHRLSGSMAKQSKAPAR
jgi:hypothetical protein